MQQPGEPFPHDVAAEPGQPGVGLDGVDLNGQSLQQGVVSEIGQPGIGPSLVDQTGIVSSNTWSLVKLRMLKLSNHFSDKASAARLLHIHTYLARERGSGSCHEHVRIASGYDSFHGALAAVKTASEVAAITKRSHDHGQAAASRKRRLSVQGCFLLSSSAQPDMAVGVADGESAVGHDVGPQCKAYRQHRSYRQHQRRHRKP